MANIIETTEYTANIYQLEQTDPVQAGEGGISNRQALQLANRTNWLFNRVQDLFVKQFYAITGATTLTAADTGNGYVLNGSSQYIMTLPAANTVPQGKGFLFLHNGDANIPFRITSGTANIGAGYGSVASIQLNPLQSFWLLSTGTGWRMVGYGAQQDVGAIQAFSRTTAPLGWLACDGAAYSPNVFADLFAELDYRYGGVNGSGIVNFKVPDLRGEFIRGLDNGRGIDVPTFTFTTNTATSQNDIQVSSTEFLYPGMDVTGSNIPANTKVLFISDATTVVLTNRPTTNATGVAITFTTRQLGSWQAASGINGHVGTQPPSNNQLAIAVNETDAVEDYSMAGQAYSNFGSSQTHKRYRVRPRNFAMLYCIKY